MFCLVTFVIIFFLLVDVSYFFNAILSLVLARFLRGKIDFIKDDSLRYGICLPSDVDLLLIHMNNSRYLRDMDFARFDFFERSGLLKLLTKKKVNFPVAAISVRYRKALSIFRPYRVRTKVVWWDSKSVYLEQRFESLPDGFVRCVALVRQAISGADFHEVIKEHYGGKAVTPPEIPQEVQKWIESNDLSSERLKKAK